MILILHHRINPFGTGTKTTHGGTLYGTVVSDAGARGPKVSRLDGYQNAGCCQVRPHPLLVAHPSLKHAFAWESVQRQCCIMPGD